MSYLPLIRIIVFYKKCKKNKLTPTSEKFRSFPKVDSTQGLNNHLIGLINPLQIPLDIDDCGARIFTIENSRMLYHRNSASWICKGSSIFDENILAGVTISCPFWLNCVIQFNNMEKRTINSKDYTLVTYRCEICRNHFEGLMKKGSGTVRLTCSFCGNRIVVYL